MKFVYYFTSITSITSIKPSHTQTYKGMKDWKDIHGFGCIYMILGIYLDLFISTENYLSLKLEKHEVLGILGCILFAQQNSDGGGILGPILFVLQNYLHFWRGEEFLRIYLICTAKYTI